MTRPLVRCQTYEMDDLRLVSNTRFKKSRSFVFLYLTASFLDFGLFSVIFVVISLSTIPWEQAHLG